MNKENKIGYEVLLDNEVVGSHESLKAARGQVRTLTVSEGSAVEIVKVRTIVTVINRYTPKTTTVLVSELDNGLDSEGSEAIEG